MIKQKKGDKGKKGWQRERRVTKQKKGGKGKEGWQRKRRVVKGGFSFGKLNINYVF